MTTDMISVVVTSEAEPTSDFKLATVHSAAQRVLVSVSQRRGRALLRAALSPSSTTLMLPSPLNSKGKSCLFLSLEITYFT